MSEKRIQEKSTSAASWDGWREQETLRLYIYTWFSSIPGTIHLWTRMGPRVDFPITTVLGFHIIN